MSSKFNMRPEKPRDTESIAKQHLKKLNEGMVLWPDPVKGPLLIPAQFAAEMTRQEMMKAAKRQDETRTRLLRLLNNRPVEL